MKLFVAVLLCSLAYANARTINFEDKSADKSFLCNSHNVGALYPHQLNPQRYYKCTEDGLVLEKCPPGDWFNFKCQACVKAGHNRPNPCGEPEESESASEEVAPEPTGAPAPPSSEEVAPVSSEEVAPVSSEEVAPVSSEEVAPVSSEEVAPEPTDAPASSEEVAPVSSEEVAPEPTDAPASSEEVVPESSEEVAPEPTDAPASSEEVVPESSEEVAPEPTDAPASSEETAPESSEESSCEVQCAYHGEYLVDPESCHSFYQCSWGVPYLHKCADMDQNGNKLVFDPSLNVCVWPRDYQCTGKPGCSVPPPPPDCPAVECKTHGQYLPNPADCHSFYQCSWGTPYLHRCAMETETTRLVFNTDLNVCVWSKDWPCNECGNNPDPVSSEEVPVSSEEVVPAPSSEEVVPAPSSEEVVPAPSSEEVVPAPSSEEVVPAPSSEEVVPAPSSEEVVPESSEESSCEVKCTEHGQYLVDPESCHSFYQCSWGVPYLHQCADMDQDGNQLVFDPSINVCVWPRDYHCTGKPGCAVPTPQPDPDSSEESTEAPVESGSEESTEAPVESGSEESTEAPVESESEESTEAPVESGSEESTEAPVESGSEESTEAPVESGSEESTEAPVESGSEESTEAPVESGSEESTEAPVESGSEESTEAPVESGSEESTEAPVESGSEESTEAPVESGSEESTEAPVESGSEESTEAPVESGSEESTEAPVESGSEESTEAPVESGSEESTEAPVESGSEESTEAPVDSGSDETDEPVDSGSDEATTPAESASDEVTPPESSSSEETDAPPADECKVECAYHGEYLVNPESCHSFYQCSWGVPYLHQCADMDQDGNQLVFDPSLNVCVWPRDYQCTGKPGCSVPPPPPDCPAVECQSHGQYLPNPADCHSFYQCSWGTPYLHHCAMETATTRLVFNPDINVCVWSEDYPCNEC